MLPIPRLARDRSRRRPGALPATVLLALASLAGALGAQDGPPAAEVPAPEVRTFLESWAEELRGLRSLRVRFEQTKHLRVLRRPRRGSGETLLSGRRLLMRVFDADGELQTVLQVTDDVVRLYYPRLERLEVYPANAPERERSPFPLMVEDVESLPREHRLQLEDAGGARWLVMHPRDPDSETAEIRIRFEDTTMTRLQQTDRKGNRVQMEITEFTVNPELDAEDLELEIPGGVEVVRFGEDGRAR